MIDQSIMDSEKSFFGKNNEKQFSVNNSFNIKNTSVENEYKE
jgi:hypothetical protein